MGAMRTNFIGVLAVASMMIFHHATVQASAADSASVAEAKTLFKNFKTYNETFDPKIVDLYADDSVIQNTRYYPNGTARTNNFYGSIYKKMMLEAIPLAKTRGDVDIYTKDTYKEIAGNKVQITASRHSKLKNYDTWTILVLAKRGPQLKIVEEHSQSRP